MKFCKNYAQINNLPDSALAKEEKTEGKKIRMEVNAIQTKKKELVN